MIQPEYAAHSPMGPKPPSTAFDQLWIMVALQV